MENVIVVGGGPAGMMSAITSAEYGNRKFDTFFLKKFC